MSSAPSLKSNENKYRLPQAVRPTHYDITIRTDLEELTFQGYAKVSLDVKEETSKIVFNSSGLDLGNAALYSEALQKAQEQSSSDVEGERVTLSFAAPLPAGSKAYLQVGFSGELTGGMVGYYKSSWERDGKRKNYSLTQFEPTAARRAFPCWDEPAIKSTFTVNLISRDDTVNLSNMPASSEEIYQADNSSNHDISLSDKFVPSLNESVKKSADKWKITRFETSPLMSTYLVAFANGHFEYLESSYKSPISGKTRPLRIYAASDIIHQAQFALDVKTSVLPLYEQVFEIEYPLPKLDTLVAHDFDSGAMENWGLITGRTSAFLLDPKRADMIAKKRVAIVQSHEVAHMWFGNITTMEWWDYLYLNEGFATLMGEVIIADKVFPEWRVHTEFITEHLNRALRLDAKLSSHPIEVYCPDADKINQIFDDLSYAKAGSILRMLSSFVGEDKFLKGVSLYLKNHLYANSVTKDLWEGIGQATGKDVNKIMDPWITKMGFPVVTVTETKEGIHVRQDRFLETGIADEQDNETIWSIPLSLLTVDSEGKRNINESILLEEREKTIPLDTSKPFKLNAGTVGVYRVLYTPERLAEIANESAKSDDIFSLEDRIGLVHDAMALAKAGLTKLSNALNLVNILKNEKEFLVWGGIVENLGLVASAWWENPQVVDLVNAFRRELYKSLVRELGYEYSDSDSADTNQLRTLVITGAANARDEEVVAELTSRFTHFMETGDDSRIPPDLQRIIFATAVRHGNDIEYDFIRRVHENPKTPTSRMAAIMAMGAIEDPQLAKETLEYTSYHARDQDVIYFFSGLASNPKTRRLAVNYFMKNYDAIYKRFEANFTMKYFVEITMKPFTREEDYKQFSEFFKDKDTSKYDLSLHQTLDTVRANAAWLERSSDDILEWLDNWKKTSKL